MLLTLTSGFSASNQPCETAALLESNVQLCSSRREESSADKMQVGPPSESVLFFAITPCVRWIINLPRRRIDFVSSNVEGQLGYAPLQLTTASSASSLLHPDDIARHRKLTRFHGRQLLKSTIEGPPYHFSFDCRLKKADGEYAWLLFHFVALATSRMEPVKYLLGGSTDFIALPQLNDTVTLSDVAVSKPADKRSPTPTANFSQRELEVLKLVAEGFTSKQIAHQLCLSVHTVNTHRKNIMGKTPVRNAAGLVHFTLGNTPKGE